MINIYETKIMKKYLQNSQYDKNPHFRKHGIKTRNHITIVGPTSSGKTNFLCNLLNQMTDTFNELIVFTTVTDEPIYSMLEAEFDAQIHNYDELYSWDKLEPKHNKLVIFDDFITLPAKKMAVIETYAILSRKYGASCVFITQNYFSLRPVLRNQTNYIVLLKMTNEKNLASISSQFALLDRVTLKNIIKDATKEKFNVCILDLLQAKVSKNFGNYYEIDSED